MVLAESGRDASPVRQNAKRFGRRRRPAGEVEFVAVSPTPQFVENSQRAATESIPLSIGH